MPKNNKQQKDLFLPQEKIISMNRVEISLNKRANQQKREIICQQKSKNKKAERQKMSFQRKQELQSKNTASRRAVRQEMSIEKKKELQKKDTVCRRAVRQEMPIQKKYELRRQNTFHRKVVRQQTSLARNNELREKDKVSKRIVRHKQAKQSKEKLDLIVLLSTIESILPFSFGIMSSKCKYCGAMYFKQQQTAKGDYNKCCKKGRINFIQQINQNRPFPEALFQLFANPNDCYYKDFHQNIRILNNNFGFISTNAGFIGNVNQKMRNNKGVPVIRIDGALYHLFSDKTFPQDQSKASHSHLYVMDQNAAEAIRNMKVNKKCEEINKIVDSVIKQYNEYANSYRLLRQLQIQQNGSQKMQTLNYKLQITLQKSNIQVDQRRYNLPTAKQIAIVWNNVQDFDQPPTKPDFVCYPGRGQIKQLKRLDLLSPLIQPFSFVLFNPFGGRGWYGDLKLLGNDQKEDSVQEDLQKEKTIKRQKLTTRYYYLHKLAIRHPVLPNLPSKCEEEIGQYVQSIDRTKFNPLHFGGKLFQQYIIRAYLTVEANDLNFLKFNQSKLKVENYKNIKEHLEKKAQKYNAQIGRKVILPSTFQGSARNMRQRYHDAMAIVVKKGKPDLFITFTCNPKWKQITQNLYPNQHAHDRPDIVTRVFKIYLYELLKDLIDRQLFGKVVGWVYTIEFQKRGLPHAHMLFILDKEFKFNELAVEKGTLQERIDMVVSAEIPDPELQPELHKLVLANMIHSPCLNNPDAICKEKGTCKRGFPKQNCLKTRVIQDQYPQYQRRQGPTDQKGVNNQYIVPYNKYLLKRFQSHINVEVCTSFHAVKYLFKYIYKGYDRSQVKYQQEKENVFIDEIKDFIDSRYVTGNQAAWRLFSFEMNQMSHSVTRLDIHLENQKRVMFKDNQQEQAIRKAQKSKSMLEAYFDLNNSSPSSKSRQLFYHQMAQHYTFSKGKWNLRKRQPNKQIISRMHMVFPSAGDLFYLRMLLLHRKGAKSYKDLRTIQEIQYPTFFETCKALNLVENDELWVKTMEEASQEYNQTYILRLFGYIVVFNQVSDPRSLWQKFKIDMMREQVHRFNFTEDEGSYKTLLDLRQIFKTHQKTNKDFNIPQPEDLKIDMKEYRTKMNRVNDGIFREKNYQEEATIYLQNIMNNGEQLEIYKEIMTALELIQKNWPARTCFYIDGPAGSGKSYLLNGLIKSATVRKYKVLPCATTGIAADLLEGGRTVHSRFKVPLFVDKETELDVKSTTFLGKELIQCNLIIIDEVSAMSKIIFQLIDKLLKKLMKSDKLFGGKIMVCCGDFRQTLPVLQGVNSQIAITDNSLLKSSIFTENFRRMRLTKNMRANGESYQFKRWLLSIGSGKKQCQLGTDYIVIPKEHLAKDIIKEIYGDQINPGDNLQQKVILSCKNIIVNQLNNKIINRLQGKQHVYHAISTVSKTDNAEDYEQIVVDYPQEFLKTLQLTGMSLQQLRLKQGAIVMLLRNLNIREGLCNGTRMRVTRMMRYSLQATIIGGKFKGKKILIPRIKLLSNTKKIPFKLARLQIPVIPAFAMTINKSQGQSFNQVGLYLENPVFSHGQLYVGLSRTTNKAGLKVEIKQEVEQGDLKKNGKIYTKNIVFKEAKQWIGPDLPPPRMRSLQSHQKQSLEILQEMTSNRKK